MSAARVALVGVKGHGRWHLDNIGRLATRGRARLVAVCDRAPVDQIGLDASLVHRDLPEMLRAAAPDVVVLATPPASHVEMATTVMAAGADVLVEKPPAVRLADLDSLIAAASQAGRLCQVGFQSLGSSALPRLRTIVAERGVQAVTAAGAWSRPHAYFERSAWAGHRYVDGVPVGDGALVNPFGHALMNALEIGGFSGSGGLSELGCVEAELFHANAIESDDTSCLRIRHDRGPDICIAVTLCADRVVEPYVCLDGSARWSYTTGELALGGAPVQAAPVTDLLENLLDARAGNAELICPPERCRTFTAVGEWLLDNADPRPIPGAFHRCDGSATTLPGITDLVSTAAGRRMLFSELGVPWASA